jgi:hypothetical protein
MATPITNPYKTSLLVDNCSSLELSCDCKKLTFKDTSNYVDSDMPGHLSTDFTSRTITIMKGDGSTFQLITADVRTNNPTAYPMATQGIAYNIIPSHLASNNTFTYTLTEADVDGIYSVELCTYPNWRADVFYQTYLKPIVLRDGKLYQAVASSTNADPADPTNSAYWTLYLNTGDCDSTRYCNKQRIVILCISIEDCYRDAVANAFCGMQKNPCKDMCDNKDFMKAMKMRVVMDGLEFAACGFDWINAQSHIDILKSLCCCNK